MISIAVTLLVVVFLSNALADSYDPLRRQEQTKWYFGQGLGIGDSFEYKICDSTLKIPESPGPCYVVTLEFLQLLSSPQGKTWIVAVHIVHQGRQADMIFQILEDSFKIKTDGTTIPYADSIEKTLGWIKKYASKFEPQTLAVGKSWGVVDSQDGTKTELVLTQVDSVQVNDITYDTHKIGYYLAKESFVQIKDGFPFPIQAVIYRPALAYQNIPPEFTVGLLSYSHSDLCNPTMIMPSLIPANDKIQPQIHNKTLIDTGQYDKLLGDDSDYEFDILSTETEIKGIENYDDYENDTLEGLEEVSTDYEKLGVRVFNNFTRILQALTEAVNQIISNQTTNGK